jgi:hypothetical protein
VNDTLSFPNSHIEQKKIFYAQLEKHIPNGAVAVISSFPLFLFDFYGKGLKKKLELS